MHRTTTAASPLRPGVRSATILCLAVALIAGGLVLGETPIASAQTQPDCEIADLGTLAAAEGSELRAAGRWTTQDCDSRFHDGSGAVTYRFRLDSGGRIRIDLSSSGADSHLTLMDGSGRSLAGDDDGGPGVDSRIERDLGAGTYLIEASTVGGQARGAAADFDLTILRVTGCDTVDLGTLEPGAGLKTAGRWTPADCGASIFTRHPVHVYRFDLPRDGRVRIDLTSDEGDPFLLLLSPEGDLIEFDDDGGVRQNSRLEMHLSGGSYRVEATTYRNRDRLPPSTEFDLSIRLIGPGDFRLKVENVITPERVTANVPFTVHYRVGNVGEGDLLRTANVRMRLYAPGVREVSERTEASAGHWRAGVSYHSGPAAAGPTSVALEEITPFEITLARSGPSWVYVVVDIHARSGGHLESRGVWRNLTVLSGPLFEPVTVAVDGDRYRVSAAETGGGTVEYSVGSVGDPGSEVESSVRAKAIYAAGVRTQSLEGVFDRAAIAALRSHDAAPRGRTTRPAVNLASPRSHALIAEYANSYSSLMAASGLAERMAGSELMSSAGAESLILATADRAWNEYAAIESAWARLQDRIARGGLLSFEEALAFQARLAYVERVLSPAIAAGDVVTAARTSASGWQDADVGDMVADLTRQASCRSGVQGLRSALRSAGVGDVEALLAVETELRSALPAYGIARDSVLCGVAGADEAGELFLEGLTIADSSPIPEADPPEAAPTAQPTKLRIIARLGADRRIEYAVELSDGERILPTKRFMSGDAAPDGWRQSSDVELDGVAIGKIRTRRLADGRVELGFRPTGADPIRPTLRYLPSDAPPGVWLRSSEIEVPSPSATLDP